MNSSYYSKYLVISKNNYENEYDLIDKKIGYYANIPYIDMAVFKLESSIVYESVSYKSIIDLFSKYDKELDAIIIQDDFYKGIKESLLTIDYSEFKVVYEFEITIDEKVDVDEIGDVINIDSEQLKIGKGFDHNYCIEGYDGKSLIDAAKIKSSKTGIGLVVSTNMPGFQFYSANNLGKKEQPVGKTGTRYEKRSAFCVEPQFFPNAINTAEFKEKGILKKGELYNRDIVYSFSND